MAKAEWGTKRQCPNCGAKFYDLNKSHPITCPKCAHAFEADVLLKPRKAKLDLKDTAAVRRKDDEEEEDLVDAEEAEVEEVEDEEAELVDEPLLAVDDEDLDEDGASGVRSESAEDIDDDIAIEDDDIDETLIEEDEDLGDEEVADMIEHSDEDKDL